MIAAQFPTSADIYLELNGKKLAVVQGYSAQTTKTSSVVEAFGESEPVATIPGPKQHTLVLTRLYATQEAAREEMECRREGLELAAEEGEGQEALCANACLVARVLRRRGKAVFGSGREALERLTAGQIAHLAG